MQNNTEETITGFKLTDPVCGMDVTVESQYRQTVAGRRKDSGHGR